MLNEAERSLVLQTFAQGPSVLLEDGYSEEDVKEFLERPEVRALWVLLEREMDLQDSLLVRQRYVARRQMQQLSRGAVAVLGQALAGPQYVMSVDADGLSMVSKDSHGRPILRRPEPTPVQLRAAEVILESLGVPQQKAKNDSSGGTDLNVEILFKADSGTTIKVADDPMHEKESQRALSREKVRTVIQLLAEKVPDLHENMRRSLGFTVDAPEAQPKKAAKRAPKKAPRKKPRVRASSST